MLIHFVKVLCFINIEKSKPCLATMTLETASGTLVPAAKNVIPITESGIFNVSPNYKKKNKYYKNFD